MDFVDLIKSADTLEELCEAQATICAKLKVHPFTLSGSKAQKRWHKRLKGAKFKPHGSMVKYKVGDNVDSYVPPSILFDADQAFEFMKRFYPETGSLKITFVSDSCKWKVETKESKHVHKTLAAAVVMAALVQH